MRWKRLETTGNVEDRRGRGRAVAGGAGGLGIIGLLLVLFLGGGNGGDVGDILGQLQAPAQQAPSGSLPPADVEAREFVSAILGSTDEYWTEVFSASGETYPEPKLVLFSGATDSACGGANSQVGPHYCPLDQTIYLDLGFFDELETRFGAKGGDFAEAYVIAHEVGHHVQKVTGIMDDVRSLQQQEPSNQNELSVRLELQADCLAGAWAHSLFEQGNVLEPGDIEEGLDAAASVGDDRIQERITGRVNPESWTHGSSEQRVYWFTQGYDSGDPAACDTFSGDA